MSTVAQKAAKGQQKAMEFLYEKNKKKIFYIAQYLLLDESQAADATFWVFKNIWGSIEAAGVESEEEFTTLAVRKAADYCKRKVLKQNPKAFHIPKDKNFLISGSVTDCGNAESYEDLVLSYFSELQRFIFILHTAGGLNNEQLASVTKLNAKTIKIALEAEEKNIEKILHATEKDTYKKLMDAFVENEREVKVPGKVDEQVAVIMDALAKPYEKKRKKIVFISIIAVVLCICIVGGIILGVRSNKFTSTSGDATTNEDSDSAADTDTDDSAEVLTGAATSELDEELTYYADIEIQDYGTITVELDQKSAPITAANFVALAESGFYDGLTFHRIMEGFMMQGGDPNGDGTGGAENNITGEFTDNGYENNLSHTRGAISMARSSAYDSASSQFFIVHEDSDYLDGSYAVFGYVTEGLDVVDAVCEAAEPTDDNGTIPAEEQPVITSITIRTE